MSMQIITRAQENLLTHLAEYKFLTNSQIVMLGGVRSQTSNMSSVHQSLMGKKPLIAKMDFGAAPKHGRYENIYHLTKHGVDFVVAEMALNPDKVKAPKRQRTVFHRDYFHRVATINFEIAFKQWALSGHHSIDMYERYFDHEGNMKKGNQLSSKCQIPIKDSIILVPDAACILSTEARRHLFLLEISFGNESKRIYEQNVNHAFALAADLPSKHFNFEKGCFVACVFDQEGCMRAVMNKMLHDEKLQAFKEHFLFKTLKEVKAGYNDNWRCFDGRRIDFV
jgi:hypothetical protein